METDPEQPRTEMTTAPEDATRRELDSVRARFEATLNAAVDGLIIIDQYGIIQAFNPAAERIFDYRAADVIGSNVKLLMPSPYRQEHDQYLANYKRTGEAKIIGIGREVRGQRRDGSTFPLDVAVGEVKSEPRQFIGIVRDISWRKEAESTLQAREAELRLIIDNAPVGILMADADFRIKTVNPAFCRLCGRSEQQLVGSIFDDLVVAEDSALVVALRRQAAVHGDPAAQDLRLVHSDGCKVHCSLHYSHTLRNGEPIFIAQIVDRTSELAMDAQLREQRERLAHAGRLLIMGEMASGIAHEITQPLTAIATYAQAVRRMFGHGKLETGVLLEAVDQIARQAERAGDIIQRLRGFMRHEEVRTQPIDIDEQLRAVIRLADVDLRHHDTRVEWQLAGSLPPVLADPVQIQQVALNLVRNAIDAMSSLSVPERIICLRSTRRSSGDIEFSVSDRGPGIGPQDRQRLFAPFFTTKEQGMGLGLSISNNIVESFGGRLWYSDQANGGACFHVTLPAA